MSKAPKRNVDVSRRRFLQQAVAGAGATAAALNPLHAAADQDAAQVSTSANANPIRIPAEFAAASSAEPVTFDFPMTGAQVFARACKEEGVAALFTCPGRDSRSTASA